MAICPQLCLNNRDNIGALVLISFGLHSSDLTITSVWWSDDFLVATEPHHHMFAIVKSSGKQYKVEPGTVVEIERINGDPGSNVEMKGVLLVCDNGAMLDAGKAVVMCQVVRHFRGEKVISFRKQRRTSNFTKKRGHRQDMTAVFIKDIKVS